MYLERFGRRVRYAGGNRGGIKEVIGSGVRYCTGMAKLLVCGRSLEELKGATGMDATKLS